MTKYVLFVLVLCAANVLFVVYGGAAWLQTVVSPDMTKHEPAVQPELIDVFAYTLEEEVKQKIGRPIEGYEPGMFLQVFPGLTETDFEGVEASSGTYHMQQGTLTFVPDDSKLMHSAAGAVTRVGMKTLLENVAIRARIDVTTGGTITDIMRVLTIQT